ncbi:hypothetical protein BwSH17_77860, partial [Bradyrhizobium ottawaense]
RCASRSIAWTPWRISRCSASS